MCLKSGYVELALASDVDKMRIQENEQMQGMCWLGIGYGRAVFVGPAAHFAALRTISHNHHSSGILEEVKHDVKDWYCPCGLSGERPLFKDMPPTQHCLI